jgi:hypothetical protein
MRLAGGYTGFPISSVLVAALAISKSRESDPSPQLDLSKRATMSFMTNSAMGLLQMFPWQTNKILTIRQI